MRYIVFARGTPRRGTPPWAESALWITVLPPPGPPPLDETQKALHARNHVAIAKVAALPPVNPNEADLSPQCIAARAHAEDMLRLLRRCADDIGLVMMRVLAPRQTRVRRRAGCRRPGRAGGRAV